MAFFSGIMDCFEEALPIPRESGVVDLSVYGYSTASGWFSSIDLFLQSDSGTVYGGSRPSGYMNMFLQGSDSARSSGELNISLGGEYPKVIASVELSLWNTGASGFMPMAIIGGGVLGGSSFAGAVVGTGIMNMYLARNPSEIIDIYLHGQGDGISGTLELSLSSALRESGFQDVAMPQTFARYSGMMNLYSHGY